jgi:hypothetical protein
VNKKITSTALFLVIVIVASVTWKYTHPPRYSEDGFNIILTKDSSKVLSGADIRSYNASSHELTLTDECADRMKNMREPLIGDFVIIVDGEEDLHGVFVPPIISRSYPSSEVVIVYPSFESDFKTMKIQMGYPWDQPTGYDPRQSSKIIQYFETIGKLIR